MSGNTSGVNESSSAPEQLVETAFGPKDTEVEIKFKTSRAGLKAALASPILGAGPKAPRRQSLRSIYFDTPAWDLGKHGIVLRIRKTGRAAPVLCAKLANGAAGGPFLRKEVEVRSPDLQLDLALFDEDLRSELIRISGGNPVEPKFETRIQRRTVLVDHCRARVEAAFDEGYVVYGERRVPLTEVELELKAGAETGLYDLAMAAAGQLPLSLDFVSKAEKGFRAATNEKPTAVKAAPLEFGADAALDDCVTAIVSGTLAHFVANWAALRETRHPESVHQLRVSLRRMRSALAMFKRMLPCPGFDDLRGEAKRIASALGPARECDVFRESAGQGPLSHPDCPEGREKLLEGVEGLRAAAYGQAISLIESPAATLFVLRVQDFLGRRAWRDGLSSADAPALTMAARQFARRTLDRLKARVLKRGKGLSKLPDEARHELRIALKNLRYGAEFFEGLFGRRRKSQAYIGRIAALQDLLGAHNDAAGAKKFVKQLLAALGPAAEAPAAFILGWNARGAVIADGELREAWKKFKRTDDFWV